MIATLTNTVYPYNTTSVSYWKSNYDSNELTSTAVSTTESTVYIRLSIRYTVTEVYKPKKILTKKELRDLYSFKKHIEETNVRRKNPFKFINRIESTVKRPVHLRGKRLDGSKWAIKK